MFVTIKTNTDTYLITKVSDINLAVFALNKNQAINKKIQKWLKVRPYFFYKAQTFQAVIFFDFKASDTTSRVDYRGGTIKNHQKTMPNGSVFGGGTPTHIYPFKGGPIKRERSKETKNNSKKLRG